MNATGDGHGLLLGYLLWLLGFTGAHRFYYGRPVTGTIWFFTLGLLGVGWLIDFFLIPSMARSASRSFGPGEPANFDIAWILLTFLGFLGIHRFYLGKLFSAAAYLLTGGLLGLGVLYDYWTLNEQIRQVNREHRRRITSTRTATAW